MRRIGYSKHSRGGTRVHLGAAGVAAVLDGAIQVGPVEHVHADAAARSRQLTHLPDQAVHSILHDMGRA